MKKGVLIYILSIILVTQANAQADCSFDYCYVGSISTNAKITKNKKIMLLVPAPEFMLNIVGEERGFREVKINDQSNYEFNWTTIGSSDFCGSHDRIVEKILKGNQKFYTVYIIKGERKYKREIKIKDIQFFHRDNLIYELV